MPSIEHQVMQKRNASNKRNERTFALKDTPIKFGVGNPSDRYASQGYINTSQIYTPVAGTNPHSVNSSMARELKENKQVEKKKLINIEHLPKFKKPEVDNTQPLKARIRALLDNDKEKINGVSRDVTPTPSMAELRPDAKLEPIKTPDILKKNQDSFMNPKSNENSILGPVIKTPITEKIFERKRYTPKPSIVSLIDKKKKCNIL